jgi:hypothetical protein
VERRIQDWDPYRIADVDVFGSVSWQDEAAFSSEEEAEWPSMDGRIVALGKRAEATNRARQYLSMNGASVWQRVDRSQTEARRLHRTSPGASLVAAVTAGELVVRFLLLRPMVAGLLFNTKLAMRLVREGSTTRTERDRVLLPDACRAWGIDLLSISLPKEQPLWETFRALIEVRNRYVHRADAIVPEQATGALESVDALIENVVRPFATRLSLDWPPDVWSHRGRTHDPVEANFDYMGS